MNLKDIRTISELAEETGINQETLKKRVYKLIEDGTLIKFKHYKKIGENQPYIFNRKGIEIILGGKRK